MSLPLQLEPLEYPPWHPYVSAFASWLADNDPDREARVVVAPAELRGFFVIRAQTEASLPSAMR